MVVDRHVRGSAHALFAYDIAFSIDLDRAERVISALQPHREQIRHRRRAPTYLQYRPSPLRITREMAPIGVGPFATAAAVELTVYDFGAISVAYRVVIDGPIGSLLDLANALYENRDLLADSQRLACETARTLADAVTRPATTGFVEDYVVYELSETSPPAAPDLVLAEHRDLLARVLRAERGPLSPQQVDDSHGSRLSYGTDDAVVIDWNAALLLGPDAEDTREVLEFANVELLEMRHLDEQLDSMLDQAYQAAGRAKSAGVLFSSLTADLRLVAGFHIDSARLFEGVNNALKLVGDQFLSRVYRTAADRFHLPDWDASILRKTHTLETIYHTIEDRLSTRRSEWLSWIIILLIAWEIIAAWIK